MKTYKPFLQSSLALILGTILSLLSACDNSSVHPGNVPITFQLNWTPDPTFAGVYIAADKRTGFFAKEGLTVEIQPGGFGIDPIAAIITKRAQFAVVGADKAAFAFSNGAPIRVVAVEFQRNPVGWMVRSSKGVKKLGDLVDRKDLVLGDKIGTETTAILSLMLKRLHLEDKIKPQAVGFETSFFFNNENSVYPVYLNEEPVTARVKGIEVTEIDPSAPENGGIILYGNVIIVHKDFVKDRPKLIKAFNTGLSAAWVFAKNKPKEAESILRQHKVFDNEQMPGVLARSITFANSFYGVDVPPGHMEITQWEKTLDTLMEIGIVKKKIYVKDLVWMGD